MQRGRARTCACRMPRTASCHATLCFIVSGSTRTSPFATPAALATSCRACPATGSRTPRRIACGPPCVPDAVASSAAVSMGSRPATRSRRKPKDAAMRVVGSENGSVNGGTRAGSQRRQSIVAAPAALWPTSAVYVAEADTAKAQKGHSTRVTAASGQLATMLLGDKAFQRWCLWKPSMASARVSSGSTTSATRWRALSPARPRSCACKAAALSKDQQPLRGIAEPRKQRTARLAQEVWRARAV